MKILKVVLIAVVFLLRLVFVSPEKNRHQINSIKSNIDTVKHPLKHRKKRTYLPMGMPFNEDEELAKNNCVLSNRYTITQRLKHYPFSKAAKYWQFLITYKI